jgi:hypothetical protein
MGQFKSDLKSPIWRNETIMIQTIMSQSGLGSKGEGIKNQKLKCKMQNDIVKFKNCE